ncbi:hypothetical protein GE21DRAFT_1215517, partial [Neurospora crassa]
KIFTKIDIRQTFYCIRIYPNYKNLIIFWMRYRLYKYKKNFINNILINYFNIFYSVYINNILIYLKNV